ncbi:hypothetical protein PXH59_00185 (plasmid) [Xenorhabdus sp. SF857]|uniref:hypothetical protein n=1 Tax=Xenorhabdus bakwenae TaxID=3026967 RepID=UPI002558215A|nr:hypothetical protein [Xenorhabdus sp. SF857]WFQ78100.1 hypothetical protein PXH59_00185 [Xenorhabdus sp. SF857]
MANKKQKFREPIRKNSVPEKNIDAFIDGKTDSSASASKAPKEQDWYELLKSSDRTKNSEKIVNLSVNEYYREWGNKLAELDSQYATRKHLFQVLLYEAMDKLIEKTLKNKQ